VTERLLDREQIHPGQVQLAGAVVPQDVRGELVRPGRKVRGGRLSQTGTQGVISDPAAGSIAVLTFGRKQRSARAGVISVELAPNVFDEPLQRPAGTRLETCSDCIARRVAS
jgi:hypothetical protein